MPPVESSDDRLAFLNTEEYAEEAIYTPAGGSGVSIQGGILNDPHFEVQTADIPLSDGQPTFLCRSEDVPVAASGGDAGDTLALAETDTHPAATYRVLDLQPDGTGMTLLSLGRLA